MTMTAIQVQRWQLTAKTALRCETEAVDQLLDDDVLVEVAGCGVCHTDLGFWSGEVRPNAPLPLCLGHEISGRVVAVGMAHKGLLGRSVVVPAVVPCGTCPLCLAGHEGICRQQKMPGNDLHGGFATHVKVPGRGLLVVDVLPAGHSLWELSVIADAVSTPYQSVVRADVQRGDGVVVVGVGGIGGFAVQIAHALGAAVVAVDINPGRLLRAAEFGAAGTVDVHGKSEDEARAAVKSALKAAGAPNARLKILEMSGHPSGQKLAWSLLGPGATLMVVGFTRDKVDVRLSNLMAFDAQALGNWGCAPRHYPAILELIRAGKVQLKPFIRQDRLSRINEVFDRVHHGQEDQRVVLIP